MINSLVDIYKKELPSFDSSKYLRGWYNDKLIYRCKLDQLLLDGQTLLSVKIIEDNEASPQNDWQSSVVFQYKDNFYYCEYREGSHGTGSYLENDTLKQVFPKTKEVTYYE